jgi:hypothetical protein
MKKNEIQDERKEAFQQPPLSHPKRKKSWPRKIWEVLLPLDDVGV